MGEERQSKKTLESTATRALLFGSKDVSSAKFGARATCSKNNATISHKSHASSHNKLALPPHLPSSAWETDIYFSRSNDIY